MFFSLSLLVAGGSVIKANKHTQNQWAKSYGQIQREIRRSSKAKAFCLKISKYSLIIGDIIRLVMNQKYFCWFASRGFVRSFVQFFCTKKTSLLSYTTECQFFETAVRVTWPWIIERGIVGRAIFIKRRESEDHRTSWLNDPSGACCNTRSVALTSANPNPLSRARSYNRGVHGTMRKSGRKGDGKRSFAVSVD